MKIGDIEKKLYQKDSEEIEKRELAEDVYEKGEKKKAESNFDKIERDILSDLNKDRTSEIEKERKKKKIVIFGAMGLALVVLVALAFWGYAKILGAAFDEGNIKITIKGEPVIKSADEASYIIKVENANRVGLSGASLYAEYPSEMILETENSAFQRETNNLAKVELGKIGGKKFKEYEIKFRFFSSHDKEAHLNAKLLYQPDNFSSNFEKVEQKIIQIKSSLVKLNIIPTREAVNGDLVEAEVIIKNESPDSFSNLELRMGYPENFKVETVEPAAFLEDKIWKFSQMGAGEEKRVKIKGIIEGEAGTVKKIKGTLGEVDSGGKFLVYTEQEESFQMISSRIEIRQEIRNEDVYAGDDLEYTLKFRNTSDISLRDLILKTYINSRVLEKSRVLASGGYYDSTDNVITWRAAEVPKLKLLMPGEEGQVTFRLAIADNFPMENENDKNFTVSTWGEIESLDVASDIPENKKIKSTKKAIKINSKLVLDTSADHSNEKFSNSGPIPLEVGKETTFTIGFDILNTSNDLENVVLKTSLPPGVSWKKNYLPQESHFEFNERTNELTLKFDKIKAGTGFISQKKEVDFQIGLIPSANQTESRIPIVSGIIVTGKDSFTKKDVQYSFQQIDLADVGEFGGDRFFKQ